MKLEQSMTAQSHPRGPIVLVLIENDLRFAWTYKLTLERAGYEVLIADDGGGGLKLAASVHPDVIVLDLGLPDMPGYEVLAKLKSREETSSIPVVTLSDGSSSTSVQICRVFGAVDDLARGRSSPELLARLLPVWITDSGQK
jgi:two-component system KDP operon response regulator KdpE